MIERMTEFPSMTIRRFCPPGVGDRRAETYEAAALVAVEQSTPAILFGGAL
jgi:hypothetical protein